MILRRTKMKDGWSRRIYVNKSGDIFVDVNLNDENPYIHSVTPAGEPCCPIGSCTIIFHDPWN